MSLVKEICAEKDQPFGLSLKFSWPFCNHATFGNDALSMLSFQDVLLGVKKTKFAVVQKCTELFFFLLGIFRATYYQ